jgi:hypothetical protein
MMAALVYQTLWVKQLAVGTDRGGGMLYAVTTAVSAFFAGLAIGGGRSPVTSAEAGRLESVNAWRTQQ